MKTNTDIRYLLVQSTGTLPEMPFVSLLSDWRRNYKGQPPYHYLILYNGERVRLLEEHQNCDRHPAFVGNAIHLAYIGGLDSKGNHRDTRSRKQESAMYDLIQELQQRYPQARVAGRNDFPECRTKCPGFQVGFWLAYYTASNQKK